MADPNPPQVIHDLYHDILSPNTLIGAVAYGVLCLVVATIAARLLRAWTHRAIRRHKTLFLDETAIGFISQMLQVLCFLLAAIFYTHLIPSLSKVATALLASASVVSLVLGLAAQNTLGLLIAGVALLIYRPFGVGDVLTVTTPTGKETGTVQDFTLGYTKLLTEDKRWIVIPNSVMISNVLIKGSGVAPAVTEEKTP